MSDTDTTTPSDSSTPTPAASEPTTTPTGAAAGDDGSASGSQPTADTFAAERAALEQRARAEQARADRLQAELEKRSQPTPDPAPSGLTMEAVRAEMRRASEIATAAVALRGEFPDADASIYTGEYDNADQLRAAVENSDRAAKATLAELAAKAEAEVRARYAERYGPLNDTPPDAGGGTTGDPSPEQLSRMSLSEMDALEAANPGVIDRILRSATS